MKLSLILIVFNLVSIYSETSFHRFKRSPIVISSTNFKFPPEENDVALDNQHLHRQSRQLLKAVTPSLINTNNSSTISAADFKNFNNNGESTSSLSNNNNEQQRSKSNNNTSTVHNIINNIINLLGGKLAPPATTSSQEQHHQQQLHQQYNLFPHQQQPQRKPTRINNRAPIINTNFENINLESLDLNLSKFYPPFRLNENGQQQVQQQQPQVIPHQQQHQQQQNQQQPNVVREQTLLIPWQQQQQQQQQSNHMQFNHQQSKLPFQQGIPLPEQIVPLNTYFHHQETEQYHPMQTNPTTTIMQHTTSTEVQPTTTELPSSSTTASIITFNTNTTPIPTSSIHTIPTAGNSAEEEIPSHYNPFQPSPTTSTTFTTSSTYSKPFTQTESPTKPQQMSWPTTPSPSSYPTPPVTIYTTPTPSTVKNETPFLVNSVVPFYQQTSTTTTTENTDIISFTTRKPNLRPGYVYNENPGIGSVELLNTTDSIELVVNGGYHSKETFNSNTNTNNNNNNNNDVVFINGEKKYFNLNTAGIGSVELTAVGDELNQNKKPAAITTTALAIPSWQNNRQVIVNSTMLPTWNQNSAAGAGPISTTTTARPVMTTLSAVVSNWQLPTKQIQANLQITSNNNKNISQQPKIIQKPKQPQQQIRIDTCILNDDSTCDQNQNCVLENGLAICNCAVGYGRKKYREECKAIWTLQLQIKFKAYKQQELKYSIDYYNPSSNLYKVLEWEIIQMLTSVLQNTALKTNLISIKLIKLSYLNGVQAQLKLEIETGGIGIDKVKDIFHNKNLLGDGYQLIAAPGEQMELTDINECTLSNNTCLPSQICVNNFGSFQCNCKQGYSLVNNKCINTCTKAFCSNRGECQIDDKNSGERICSCAKNYYGTNCEIDGEILAVTIGTSLAAFIIITLTLICLCLWSRRWKQAASTIPPNFYATTEYLQKQNIYDNSIYYNRTNNLIAMPPPTGPSSYPPAIFNPIDNSRLLWSHDTQHFDPYYYYDNGGGGVPGQGPSSRGGGGGPQLYTSQSILNLDDDDFYTTK